MRDALKEIVPTLRGVSAAEQPPETSHMDANIEERLRILFAQVDRQLGRLFPDSILRAWARSMVGHTNRHSKKQIAKVMSAVDINVEPLLHDKELNPFFQNIIDENVGLIKSIPTERMTAFKNALVNGITQDMPSAQIAVIIQKHIGKDGNVAQRAKLIATDQVGKLNGRLNQYRQQQLGGKRYRWRTAGDERVAGNPQGKYPNAKPSHWLREGKIYSWDKPPPGGHPKQRVRCRCYAEMVVEDIVE